MGLLAGSRQQRIEKLLGRHPPPQRRSQQLCPLDISAYSGNPTITFCTFDERQAKAARAERFTVVPGSGA